MDTRILMSILMIGVVAMAAGAGTFAQFSDTETSTGNTFTAGVIDLEVDCSGDTTFAAQDDPLPVIFDKDIKPGDSGEVTLSLHLKEDSNNADLSMTATNLECSGGDSPESEEAGDDDISDDIEVLVWKDYGDDGIPDTMDNGEGDNVKQTGEEVIHDGTVASLVAEGKITVQENAEACKTYYIGFKWELPSTVGNTAQGDECSFDLVFSADQIV